MSVEEIVKKIIAEEADLERNQILDRAKSEAAAIVKKAQTEVDKAVEWNKPIFEHHGSVARARLVHQAEFEAQTKTADEKQRLYQLFLDKVSTQLKSISGKPEYKELMKSLIQEALKMIEGSANVHVRKEDAELAKEVLRDLSRADLNVIGDLNAWGGVRIESLDGTVSLDNTLNSRFAKALEVYKESIGKDLFG